MPDLFGWFKFGTSNYPPQPLPSLVRRQGESDACFFSDAAGFLANHHMGREIQENQYQYPIRPAGLNLLKTQTGNCNDDVYF